jgi:hypothetical protein
MLVPWIAAAMPPTHERNTDLRLQVAGIVLITAAGVAMAVGPPVKIMMEGGRKQVSERMADVFAAHARQSARPPHEQNAALPLPPQDQSVQPGFQKKGDPSAHVAQQGSSCHLPAASAAPHSQASQRALAATAVTKAASV